MDTTHKSCFPPVYASGARLLICGSLPGEASLRAQRYYAHPQNQFWRLLGAMLEEPLAEMEYEGRLETVKRHHVALWDTVATARRQGSLDSAIQDITPSPLKALISALPELRRIAFNGQRAAQIGRRQLCDGWLERSVVLPSSSPAFAARSFAQKLPEWQALAAILAD